MSVRGRVSGGEAVSKLACVLVCKRDCVSSYVAMLVCNVCVFVHVCLGTTAITIAGVLSVVRFFSAAAFFSSHVGTRRVRTGKGSAKDFSYSFNHIKCILAPPPYNWKAA